jgi:DNA replication protein DnaC
MPANSISEAVCPLCAGSGWKIVERDGMSGAERCDCALQAGTVRIEERAGIPPLYADKSIHNFVLPQDNPVGMSALSAPLNDVRTFIRKYPILPKPGLIFIGAPGTGKTHLAVAVLRGLIVKGFEGVFFDFQNLLDRIRSGYDTASGTMDKEAYRTALETDVLVLDDLGAHRVTDWVEDTVTSIITYRCNHRKSTIVTTNLRDEQAGDERGSGIRSDLGSKFFLEERIGMRARSRLFEMCTLIKMPAVEDYRLRKRST